MGSSWIYSHLTKTVHSVLLKVAKQTGLSYPILSCQNDLMIEDADKQASSGV